jgi:hypothetical protein
VLLTDRFPFAGRPTVDDPSSLQGQDSAYVVKVQSLNHEGHEGHEAGMMGIAYFLRVLRALCGEGCSIAGLDVHVA